MAELFFLFGFLGHELVPNRTQFYHYTTHFLQPRSTETYRKRNWETQKKETFFNGISVERSCQNCAELILTAEPTHDTICSSSPPPWISTKTVPIHTSAPQSAAWRHSSFQSPSSEYTPKSIDSPCPTTLFDCQSIAANDVLPALAVSRISLSTWFRSTSRRMGGTGVRGGRGEPGTQRWSCSREFLHQFRWLGWKHISTLFSLPHCQGSAIASNRLDLLENTIFTKFFLAANPGFYHQKRAFSAIFWWNLVLKCFLSIELAFFAVFRGKIRTFCIVFAKTEDSGSNSYVR